MKRLFFTLFMLAAFLLTPSAGFADSYELADVDMTITFDDAAWWVFTRDNITDNAQLTKLGTDEETMRATMEKSHAYAVAVKGGAAQRIELLARVADNEYINNMTALTDSELEALKKGVDENYSKELDDYSSEVMQLGGCTYIRMTGRYNRDDYDVIQYMTFVNGRNYLFSVQKVVDFTREDRKEIRKIVRNIDYRLDPHMTENNVEAYVKDKQDSLAASQKSLPTKIIMTAAVVIVIVFLLWFLNRRRNR